MSRPANPYDNASCESFLKTWKREEIYANPYRDLDHLRANIPEFIERYDNQPRLHSALGYRSPEEFEREAKHADAMTQLCSPSLEFFPGTAERISTRMPEPGTQTPSPAPDPAKQEMTQTQSNGTCVIENCLTLWVHPVCGGEAGWAQDWAHSPIGGSRGHPEEAAKRLKREGKNGAP